MINNNGDVKVFGSTDTSMVGKIYKGSECEGDSQDYTICCTY